MGGEGGVGWAGAFAAAVGGEGGVGWAGALAAAVGGEGGVGWAGALTAAVATVVVGLAAAVSEAGEEKAAQVVREERVGVGGALGKLGPGGLEGWGWAMEALVDLGALLGKG
jgi:hypothetical protein